MRRFHTTVLRQLTDLKADVYEGVWSRDGSRMLTAATLSKPHGVWAFSTASLATRTSAQLIRTPTSSVFSIEAWSPDQKRIAGSMLSGAGNPQMPAVWEFPDGPLRTFDVPSPSAARDYAVAGWLPDSRRVLVASARGLTVIEATTGTTAVIPGAPAAFRYRLTPDGRTLFFERVVRDGDIWLMDMERR